MKKWVVIVAVVLAGIFFLKTTRMASYGRVMFENFLFDHLTRETTDAREMAPLARHRHPAPPHRLQIAADSARLQDLGLDLMVAAVLTESAVQGPVEYRWPQ